MFLRPIVCLSVIAGLLQSTISWAETKAVSGGLTDAQKASLKALGIPIAIPNYLPKGFQVSRVIAERCAAAPRRGLCREGPYYSILYRDATNTCLLVNAVGGGVGGGDDEFQFSTRTKLLGEVPIGFNPGRSSGKISARQHLGQAPKPEQLRIPQQELSSFPAMSVAGRSPYYNVVASGAQYYQEKYGCGKNRSVTPLDLEKVLQSLAWLQ